MGFQVTQPWLAPGLWLHQKADGSHLAGHRDHPRTPCDGVHSDLFPFEDFTRPTALPLDLFICRGLLIPFPGLRKAHRSEQA